MRGTVYAVLTGEGDMTIPAGGDREAAESRAAVLNRRGLSGECRPVLLLCSAVRASARCHVPYPGTFLPAN